MKTLKHFATVLLAFLSISAFASDETASYKLGMDYALKAYIDAVVHGNMKTVSDVLDRDAKLTYTRESKILNYTKADILNLMKSSENIEQNCNVETNIVESNQTQTIVKVTMKYDTFSRIDYLNIANTTKGWKITNITSTFN